MAITIGPSLSHSRPLDTKGLTIAKLLQPVLHYPQATTHKGGDREIQDIDVHYGTDIFCHRVNRPGQHHMVRGWGKRERQQQLQVIHERCKSIAHAISLASSGDSIMIAAATYKENLSISKSLNIIGFGASTTIIDGGGVNCPARFSVTSCRVVTISPATTATLSGLTIRNGSARYSSVGSSGDGGGIYSSGTLTINNSTVSGNTASPSGGGISSNGGTLTISNSTISGNSAGDGGGIGASGTVKIQNSIVANNTGGNCSGGTMTSHGHNLSSDNTCNFNGPGDMKNINPMLGTLGNYGGPTQTIPLLSGSPAIDAGNPSGCTDGSGHLMKTDQRGQPRPDPEDTGGCDIGAYERQKD